MNFHYADYFGGSTPSTGYERLLYDCMCGDATLFQRADMVEAGWSVVAPILDVWKALPALFSNYASVPGIEEADDLLERDGRHWRNISNILAGVWRHPTRLFSLERGAELSLQPPS
jgi:glucose-6-phosphate 1-dehydrogenase